MPASTNATMIVISRIFATDVLTMFIWFLSNWPKPQMMAPTTKAMPPRVRSMVRLSRLMRWYIEVMMMPATVEKKVASSMGINTSVGWAAPNCALYTMMDMGMSVSPDVLSTRNIIMGLVAVSLFGLSVCSCSIAFSPSGVAALSSPNILAAMFMNIAPVTG